MAKIQEGLGDKIGNFFQFISASLGGILIGFIYGWKLTLVIFAVSPLMAIGGGFMAAVSQSIYHILNVFVSFILTFPYLFFQNFGFGV